MMRVASRLLLVGLVGLVTGAAAPPSHVAVAPSVLPAGAAAAVASIAGSRIAADVAFLADDAFEGRATGSRGFLLAAAYVANRFATLGLEPGGDSAWFQRVPFRLARLDGEGSSIALVRGDQATGWRLGKDALVAPDQLRELVTSQGALAFVGYGVSAPELGYDDFASLDVTGKVVVEFSGAPPRFPNDQRAYYGSRQVKEQLAAAHGAAGMLLITRPADRARTNWGGLARQWGFPAYRWVDAGGAPVGVQPLLAVIGRLSDSCAAGLFDGAPKSFAAAAADADSSVAGGCALPASVQARVASRHSAAASPNVVAFLRGSDPKLAGEAIVLTAHLDHLGITAPIAGDSINNGAYDNASGTATLLEVARAFARMPVRPRRSLLFVSVTGEEEGLLGSDFFARHAAPAGLREVAELNLDELLVLRPTTRVIAVGAEHSSLGETFDRAARMAGFEVMPNPTPENVPFVRSDQFSFVKQGVPSVFPRSGADGTPEGLEELHQWTMKRYHSPSDDMSQPFDWESSARFARLVFDTAWLVAEAPQAPKWHADDFFAKKFAATR
jgi:hypothetical protein